MIEENVAIPVKGKMLQRSPVVPGSDSPSWADAIVGGFLFKTGTINPEKFGDLKIVFELVECGDQFFGGPVQRLPGYCQLPGASKVGHQNDQLHTTLLQGHLKNSKQSMANTRAVGFEMGTTHSCIGVLAHRGVEVIASDQRNRTSSSSVPKGVSSVVLERMKENAEAYLGS